jgi:flagellar hook-associated protein 1 FlgK
VNLDEEAANLLRFQQAYQAAAQLIRVASTMFDSLLAATNR